MAVDRRASTGRRPPAWRRCWPKEHTVERDNAIILAVDCEALRCEPIDGVGRVDRCGQRAPALPSRFMPP